MMLGEEQTLLRRFSVKEDRVYHHDDNDDDDDDNDDEDDDIDGDDDDDTKAWKGAAPREAWDFNTRDRQQKPSGDYQR